jgi:hypothetical protein
LKIIFLFEQNLYSKFKGISSLFSLLLKQLMAMKLQIMSAIIM